MRVDQLVEHDVEVVTGDIVAELLELCARDHAVTGLSKYVDDNRLGAKGQFFLVKHQIEEFRLE
jgi:hypothetical protein